MKAIKVMKAMKTTLSIQAKFTEFEPFIVNLANQGKLVQHAMINAIEEYVLKNKEYLLT